MCNFFEKLIASSRICFYGQKVLGTQILDVESAVQFELNDFGLPKKLILVFEPKSLKTTVR